MCEGVGEYVKEWVSEGSYMREDTRLISVC